MTWRDVGVKTNLTSEHETHENTNYSGTEGCYHNRTTSGEKVGGCQKNRKIANVIYGRPFLPSPARDDTPNKSVLI